MSTVLPAAAIPQGASISSNASAQTLFRLANGILEAANDVRVNGNLAMAISRRAKDMASVLASLIDEQVLHPGSEPLRGLERALADVENELGVIRKKSYLYQLVNQQRNRSTLTDLSERMGSAFEALMGHLRVKTIALAGALVDQVAALRDKACDQLHASEPSDSASFSKPQTSHLPQPRPHFGRTTAVQHILDALLSTTSGRVAVLGGPGIGKTTVSVAVLHNPAIVGNFGERRFFVPCDGAEDHSDCLALIAASLGIVSSDPKVIRQMLWDSLAAAPTLLVLDNFESAWESASQRQIAEDALQFFDGMDNLSLIVTLRGRERPQGVRWTRPFLEPLGPLPDSASKQTFLSIADVSDVDPALDSILAHLDNVPLAVVLMANLAQTESTAALVRRWNEVQTAMLVIGDGQSRSTSLDVSIRMSLQAPRMQAVPHARALLAALSLLPHGITETDVRLLHIGHNRETLSVLLQTSLVSRRPDDRIFVLAPIRAFMLSQYPPSQSESSPIYSHYFNLAGLAETAVRYTFDAEGLAAIAAELGNIYAVIQHALTHNQQQQAPAVKAAVSLCRLYSRTSMGSGGELLPTAVAVAKSCGFHKLHADLLMSWAAMSGRSLVPGNLWSLYDEAHALYELCRDDDGILESAACSSHSLSPQKAIDETRRLIAIEQSRRNYRGMARCAQHLGEALRRLGDIPAAIGQYELAIRIAQEKDSNIPEETVAHSKFHIARMYRLSGDLRGAAKLHEEALHIWEATQNPYHLGMVYIQLVQIEMARGNPLEAINWARQGLALQRHAGLRNYVSCLLLLAESHAQVGDVNAAIAVVDDVDHLRPSEGWPVFEQCDILYTRGCLAHWRGDAGEARVLLSAAVARARTPDMIEGAENMLRAEAMLVVALSDVDSDSQERCEAAALQALGAAVILRLSKDTIQIIRCLVIAAEATVDEEFAGRLVHAVLLPAHRIGLSYDVFRALLRSAITAQRSGRCSLAVHRAQSALRYIGDIKDQGRLRTAAGLLQTAGGCT